MASVVLTKGLPGSGKSTWAKAKMQKRPGQYKRVSKDEIRAMLDDGVYSPENEKVVRDVRNAAILVALHTGFDVIVDDTNLNPRHVQEIQALVLGQADVQILDFTDILLEVCIKRDSSRPNPVGENVIREMHQRYLGEPKAILEKGASGIGG